jgi:hypothetical protein
MKATISGLAAAIAVSMVASVARAEEPRPVASTVAPAPEPPDAWKRPAAVVTLGAGLVLVGVAIGGAAQVQSVDDAPGFQAYVRGFGSREDACSAADAGTRSHEPGAVAASVASDACKRRATWRGVEYVAGGLGLVSIGAAVWMFVTMPPKGAEPPKTTLLPRVDGHSAGMDFVVRF